MVFADILNSIHVNHDSGPAMRARPRGQYLCFGLRPILQVPPWYCSTLLVDFLGSSANRVLQLDDRTRVR